AVRQPRGRARLRPRHRRRLRRDRARRPARLTPPRWYHAWTNSLLTRTGPPGSRRVEEWVMNVRLLALATALGLVLSLMGSTAADAAPKKRPDLVVRSLSVA